MPAVPTDSGEVFEDLSAILLTTGQKLSYKSDVRCGTALAPISAGAIRRFSSHCGEVDLPCVENGWSVVTEVINRKLQTIKRFTRDRRAAVARVSAFVSNVKFRLKSPRRRMWCSIKVWRRQKDVASCSSGHIFFL